MPDLNDTILDRIVLHHMRVLAVGNKTARAARKLLREAHADIVERLMGRLEKAAELGYDTGPVTTRRLQKLESAFNAMQKESASEAVSLIRREAVDVGIDETQFQRHLFAGEMPVHYDMTLPATSTVRAAVTMQPFGGKTMAVYARDLSQTVQRRFAQQLRISLVNGETIPQLVRRIRGTRAGGFRDGILGWQRWQAEALARTSVNHASTQARMLTYRENADLIKGVTWVATLDTRTCLQCANLDNRRWGLEESHITTPAHINCRCTLAPVTRSWREMGYDIDEVDAGRATMNGHIPKSRSYPEWLKNQTSSTQREALGPARYARYKAGKEDVSEFVNRQGRTLTLDELRRREERG